MYSVALNKSSKPIRFICLCIIARSRNKLALLLIAFLGSINKEIHWFIVLVLGWDGVQTTKMREDLIRCAMRNAAENQGKAIETVSFRWLGSRFLMGLGVRLRHYL